MTWDKLRVFYVNCSILQSIPRALDVQFPEPMRTFLELIDLSSLNPLDLISGECVNASLSRYDTRVIVTTIGVMSICVVNWLVYGIRWLAQASDDKRRKAFSDHAGAFFALTYVFYPTLSLLQFRGLVCEEYEDGEIRLLKVGLNVRCKTIPHCPSFPATQPTQPPPTRQADLSIDCDADEDYRIFVVLNAIFIVITQLIPLMYLTVLYRIRHLLHPPSNRSPQAQLRDRQRREREEHTLQPYTFLFTHYNLGWWRFETVEAYR